MTIATTTTSGTSTYTWYSSFWEHFKYCPNCGKKTEEDWSYCPDCGRYLCLFKYQVYPYQLPYQPWQPTEPYWPPYIPYPTWYTISITWNYNSSETGKQ